MDRDCGVSKMTAAMHTDTELYGNFLSTGGNFDLMLEQEEKPEEIHHSPESLQSLSGDHEYPQKTSWQPGH